uniref:Uncharacterized protein n=1 Tax=Oryza punctata TaxID=4537 RepID=A0A0E0LVB8_ORYPU
MLLLLQLGGDKARQGGTSSLSCTAGWGGALRAMSSLIEDDDEEDLGEDDTTASLGGIRSGNLSTCPEEKGASVLRLPRSGNCAIKLTPQIQKHYHKFTKIHRLPLPVTRRPLLPLECLPPTASPSCTAACLLPSRRIRWRGGCRRRPPPPPHAPPTVALAESGVGGEGEKGRRSGGGIDQICIKL